MLTLRRIPTPRKTEEHEEQLIDCIAGLFEVEFLLMSTQ